MLPVKDINHCKKAMNLPIVLRKSLTNSSNIEMLKQELDVHVSIYKEYDF